MRAILCKTLGGPDSVALAQVEPPAMANNQVRVGVRACGLNFPDVLMIAGKYQVRPPLPFIPGAEMAGEIVAIGSGVRGFELGQRVLALCAIGGLAEQVSVDAERVVAIPDDMDFTTAAAFMLTYGTAWHALKQRAQLQAGEKLLVLGAAGGVGLATVELGTILGADVIAAASNAEKLALAKQCGAKHLIDYSREDLKVRLKDITDGKGVDVVLDPVGGEYTETALRALGWKGRLLVVGFASGSIPKLPANLALLKGTAIIGVFWGSFTEREPQAHRRNTKQLLSLYREGQLRPHVSETFPLEAASRALKRLSERQAMGKLVVTIN